MISEVPCCFWWTISCELTSGGCRPAQQAKMVGWAVNLRGLFDMQKRWFHDFVQYVHGLEHVVQSLSTRRVDGGTLAVEPREIVQRPSRNSQRTRVRETDQLSLELARAKDRISELARSQVELTSTIARLNERASTDVLTGLNNRRRFDEALELNFSLAVRQQSPLSAIMIDVDSFKSY